MLLLTLCFFFFFKQTRIIRKDVEGENTLGVPAVCGEGVMVTGGLR